MLVIINLQVPPKNASCATSLSPSIENIRKIDREQEKDSDELIDLISCSADLHSFFFCFSGSSPSDAMATLLSAC